MAPCICRREHRLIGKECTKPEETCLVFGMGADYYQRNGLSRVIDLQETLDLLKRADEAGLVLQPSNAKEIVNICCCCGCCCGVLLNIKRFPKPADLVLTPFVMELDSESCSGCGICTERCQMDALSVDDEKVRLDVDRCIGCGLCVSTCETESLKLVRKPEFEQQKTPENLIQQSIKLGQSREKMRMPSLLGMQLKSKMDRLMASL